MYPDYWGLKQSPFQSGASSAYFFPSPTHEEALARLFFLVENQRRLGFLLGPTGSGKTATLEIFAEKLRRQGARVAAMNIAQLTPEEFLEQWTLAWGIEPGTDWPLSRYWRVLLDVMIENQIQRVDSILLLDDADEASSETLDQVKRLVRQAVRVDSRMTVVLSGKADHLGRFDEALLEWIDLRIDLEPWSVEDVELYFSESLRKAGRKRPIFTPDAVRRMYELTGGVPRRLAQLADLSLIAGAGNRLCRIDAEAIDSVYSELAVVQI